MGIVESIRVCLFKKYSKLDDRASRSEYWWFCLFSVIVHLFINYHLTVEFFDYDEVQIHHVAYIVVAVLLLLPWYTVGMRRMHDAGYSEVLGNLGVFSTFFVIYFTSIALFASNSYASDEVLVSIVILFLLCGAMAFAFIIFAATPGTPAENEYGSNPLLTDGNNSYFQDLQYQSPQDYHYIEPQNFPYPSSSQMQPMQGQNLTDNSMDVPADSFNQPNQHLNQHHYPAQTNFTPFNPEVVQDSAQQQTQSTPQTQWQNQEQGQEQEQFQPNYMAQATHLPMPPQAPLFDDIPQVNLTAEELQNLGFSKVNESVPQDKPQNR